MTQIFNNLKNKIKNELSIFENQKSTNEYRDIYALLDWLNTNENDIINEFSKLYEPNAKSQWFSIWKNKLYFFTKWKNGTIQKYPNYTKYIIINFDDYIFKNNQWSNKQKINKIN